MKNYYIEILKYAMDMEEKVKAFYITYRDRAKEESTKKIFNELANTQDKHFKVLQKMIDIVEKDEKFDELEVKKLKGGSDIFKLNTEIFDKADFTDIVEDLPILKLAYSLENDFAEFYQKAAEKAENKDAKKLLEKLAQWKISHKDYFSDEIKDASDDYWVENDFSPF